MSRLLPKLAGIAAVAAVVLSVGVGSAAAKVTRYHESDGTVVSISTPNVATTAGSQTQASVTVSVSGPSPLYIGPEGFLTGSGQGDGKWDGLSFVHYGCWTHAGRSTPASPARRRSRSRPRSSAHTTRHTCSTGRAPISTRTTPCTPTSPPQGCPPPSGRRPTPWCSRHSKPQTNLEPPPRAATKEARAWCIPRCSTTTRNRFDRLRTVCARRQLTACRRSACARERRSAMEAIVRTPAARRSGLGELSSATSGPGCRSARCGVRAAWDGFAGAGRHEREQAPTASSGTAACPGVATLLLTARSRRSGCLLASTSGAPGGCSGVALAMRPMLVAQTRKRSDQQA